MFFTHFPGWCIEQAQALPQGPHQNEGPGVWILEENIY